MKNKSNTSLSLRKMLLSALVAAPLATLPAPLWALPNTASTNVTSSSSTTTFTPSGSILTVTDTTANRLVLKWGVFGGPAGTGAIGTQDGSIRNGETVIFTLPSSSAAVLNTVSSGATVIDGALQSNGSIYILNPAGVTLSSTATVTAQNLGISTVPEAEFFFLANGNLSYSGTATAPAVVAVASSGTPINVGSSGSVYVVGKTADISGNINAGTLNVTTQNGQVNLSNVGALTIGTNATSTVAGNGNLVVTTGGGSVNVANAATTTVRGGTATFTTSGGNITQTGSNLLSVGDTQNNSTLTLNTGSGRVTLGSGSTAGLTTPSGSDRVGINLTSGITQIVSSKRLQLNSGGTVTGNTTISTDALTVRTTTGGSIDNGGDITVTGGQINLRTDAVNSGITFKGPGDLTFSGLTTAVSTGSAVTLTSTTGSVLLPAATIGGSLTVTAQNNITQAGALIVNTLNTRTGSFDAVTGSVTLTSSGNDFTNLVVKNAPGGASVTDINDLTLASGTSTAASLTIVAPNGVKLGNGAGDTITVGGDLNITSNTAAGLASLAITNGGSGYTAAPALTFSAGGGTASTTLTVTAVVQPTGSARGSGYTSVPTVTVSSGSATASATVAIDTTVLTAGSGYTSAPTVTFSAAPSGGSTAQGTTTLTINTAVIANAGSGYTTAPTVTILGGGAGSATATIDTTTGAITGVTFTGATGYATAPSITFGAVAGASPAGQSSTTGQVGALTVANAGTGYTSVPTILFGSAGGGTGASATSLVRIDTVQLISGGSGYSVTPTLTFSASPGLSASVVSTTGSVSATSIGSIGSATSVAQPAVTATAPGVGGTAAAITAFAGAGVSDVSNNVTVLGKLNITTPGIVAINGNTDNGVGLNHRFGQVNINQASGLGVTIYETTTLNLGNIATTGTLRAYSAAGDIVNSDKIAAAVVEVGAGTAVAPGNITLDNNANAITGRLSVIDDIALLSNTAAVGTTIGSQTVGNYLARNLTVTNTTPITIGLLNSTLNTGIGNLTVTATGASSTITLSRTNLSSTGVLTLSSESDITASDTNNLFAVANVTSKGNVSVVSSGATTFNATLTQPSSGTPTALFRTVGGSSNLTIGTVTSDYAGQVEFRSGANTTTALQDSVAGLKIFGPTFFNSSGSVTINRAGHNFGTVSVTAANNRSASVTESGTLKLGSVQINNTGSFTATSANGDIIQTGTDNGIRFGNNAPDASMTATLVANNGNIVLDSTNGTTNRIPRLVATAAGNVTVNNTRATALGNITAGGFLTLNSNGSDITQVSGSKLNVYDTFSLTSGAGNITVANTGNRLGGIALSSTGNVAITESTTMNLVSVIVSGTFAATSENGDIINSTRSVTNNFLAGNTANTTPLGDSTFSAPKGNIALTLSSSNYGVVAFNTAGNVSLVDAAGNTTLTTSTIGGTLDVTNLATYAAGTAGTINQTGAVKASGNTTLITNLGRIDLSNGSNEFGALRFVVGTPGAAIAENTTLNLRGGTSSSGTVQLSTNGNFITSGGASFFSSDLIISAQGTIIPTAGSLFITPAGTLTVFSPSAKDLSALSKSSNLSNKDPINLGSGSYSGPSQ